MVSRIARSTCSQHLSTLALIALCLTYWCKVSLAAGNAAQGCVPGRHQLDASCYWLVETSHGQHFPSVFEAQRLCRAGGGHLATMTTEEVDRSVVGYLGNLTSPDPPTVVYIGLHNVHQEALFSWLTGSAVTYSHWGHGQPETRGERCVTAISGERPWRYGAVTWHDYPCCHNVDVSAALCQQDLHDEGLNSTLLDEIEWELARQCPHHFNCSLETLPYIRNGRHDIKAPHVPLDTQATYTCDAGSLFSRLTPSKTLTCAPWGWHPPDMDDCREKRCVPNPHWLGLIANESKHNYSPGDVINYTCQDELWFDDDSTSKFALCDDDESWFPPLENCSEARAEVRRRQRKAKMVAEAEGAAFMGSIAIIVISVELGLVVFSDLQTLTMHLKVLVNNIRSRLA